MTPADAVRKLRETSGEQRHVDDDLVDAAVLGAAAIELVEAMFYGPPHRGDTCQHERSCIVVAQSRQRAYRNLRSER